MESSDLSGAILASLSYSSSEFFQTQGHVGERGKAFKHIVSNFNHEVLSISQPLTGKY